MSVTRLQTMVPRLGGCQGHSDPKPFPLGTTDFGFRAKAEFTASAHLCQMRSAHLCQMRSATYQGKEETVEYSHWKVSPPDFSVRYYAPKGTRRIRIASHPACDKEKRVQVSNEKRGQGRDNEIPAHPPQHILRPRECGRFTIRFRITRPDTARRIAARIGKIPAGQYVAPRPHDHRALPPIKDFDLPEFVTSWCRGAYDTELENNSLSTLRTTQGTETEAEERDVTPPFSTRKSSEPKWEHSLSLSKDPYRKRYAAFTRHRRLDRTAHSALMDRAESHFMEKWYN